LFLYLERVRAALGFTYRAGSLRGIPKTLDKVVEQHALHRIVVNDKGPALGRKRNGHLLNLLPRVHHG
tara:strand:- start:12 stop:215 length:204 start_codon:yes stop_codon:yes gene_type:complete